MSKKSKQPSIVLRDHVYDGIEEYDQKLPNWWLFTLYIMIVWFVFAWVAYYQLPFRFESDHERLDRQIAAIEQKKQEELEEMLASLSNESLLEMSLDATHTAAGQSIYQTLCAACHGADLSATLGGIPLPGVALNDGEWIHGGDPLQIMHLITNGSPNVEKGMIAFSAQLSPSQIAQVTAYILSQQP